MITAAIAIATILLVLTRPRRISEGVAALAGAAAMLATGRLTPASALDTMGNLLGVLAFLFGLFWLTLACDRAGLFAHAARLAVQYSGGNGRRLLFAVFVLGTITTTILSNDATVVLVTPVILLVCRQHSLPPLPYLFACTFVADSASSMLPVANPINLLYGQRFAIDPLTHAQYMIVPTILGVLTSWLVFHLLFRAAIPQVFARTAPEQPREPASVIDRAIIGGLGIVVLGYVASAPLGVSPYWITLAGGVLLAAIAVAGSRATPVELVKVQPPALYAFVAGLALLVAAVDGAGLLDAPGRTVLWAADAGPLTGLLAVTFGTALGTNLVNNWTMALAMIPALEGGGASDLLIFGSMLGADIGPNLSVVGSLATLIWLTQIRSAGLAVSARTYLRLGLAVTVPSILVATLALYLTHLIVT